MAIDGVMGGGLQGVNLQEMDMETALMMVQTQRNNLLEDQLRQQLEGVKVRNDNMARMQGEINAKNAEASLAREDIASLQASVLTEAQRTAASDTVSAAEKEVADLTEMRSQLNTVLNRDPTYWTGLSWGWGGDDKAKSAQMKTKIESMNLPGADKIKDIDNNGTWDAHPTELKQWISELDKRIATAKSTIDTNKAAIANSDSAQSKVETLTQQVKTLEAEVADLKAKSDAEANSQQMDMLRLQSLSNKRNEAFDTMTNFMKKQQDSRSSIISNLR